MKRERRLEVTQWTAGPVIAPRVFPAARKFRISPKIAGLIGTVILHGIAIQLVMPESSAVKAPRPIRVPGDVESSDNREAPLTLMSLPAVGVEREVSVHENLSAQALAVTAMDISQPAPVNIAEGFDSNQDRAGPPSAGDEAEHTRLAGIYSTQVSARIERLWRRPRSPVDENAITQNEATKNESFQCQVQIVQDPRGNVREVLLPSCNGSVAWQHSLVMAVQQASPLPAPPSPEVFSPSIALSFLGLPYVPGAAEDDYEIAGN
jgi:TonB C terminal